MDGEISIYFAGSITGGRTDQALYREIIRMLSRYGRVLTEHVGDENLTVRGEEQGGAYIYKRDMR